MPRPRELHDYVVRKYLVDERGQFTRKLLDSPLTRVKYAEYRARSTSRNTPTALVTLTRDGLLISHFIDGRPVTPEQLVARAGAVARGG
jgi:hypothetical protein